MMAEVRTTSLPARGILYSELALKSFASPHTRLRAIEPGDRCCHCRRDCDGEGFANGNWTAYRVNGHPICARSQCYGAKWDEFKGIRSACHCGRRNSGER
jgi:hypothetical protein